MPKRCDSLARACLNMNPLSLKMPRQILRPPVRLLINTRLQWGGRPFELPRNSFNCFPAILRTAVP